MRIFLFPSLILTCITQTAIAQEAPGNLSGTIDGISVDFPLDCRSWGNEQSMVFGADDGRSGRDQGGDGFAMNYSFLRGPDVLTDMFVTLQDTRFNLGPVFGSDDATGGWDIDENGARLTGVADNFGKPIDVDLVLDCAPRSDVARGFTGTVTGVLDGQSVDVALFCGNWNAGGFLEATTPDSAVPFLELVVFPNGTDGSVTAKTDDRDYQLAVMPIAGTEFETTDDTVSLTADMVERGTQRAYQVDLTFDCSER